MADLKFKVGAAIDATWDTVFGSIVAKATKARKQIAAEMSAGAQSFATPYRTNAAAAGSALSKVGTQAKTTGDVIGRVADGAGAKFAELSKGIKKIPADLTAVAREAERELQRIERAKARAVLGIGGGGRGGMDGGSFAQRMGYWTQRNLSPVTPMLSMGAHIARDIGRGAGIDLDLQSQVAKSVERQDLATRLSIQGFKSYKAGTSDPNGVKVSAGTLQSEAFAHGGAVGMDANEILRAQTKFVDLTGDLNTARGIMAELGKVSNATGTSMEDTASAAASISVALETTYGENVQGKIAATKDILLHLAGQGKEGAVELKNYAAQMSKVAAAANQLGGDRGEAFTLVGMLVQQSKKTGGSATATTAANTVAGLLAELNTDAARKHPHLPFINDIYNKDAKGHRTSVKSLPEIVEAAVLKSAGDPVTIRNWFGTKLSGQAVQGFAAVYRDAERKTPGSGKAALEEELKTLHDAVVSEDDVRKANVEVLTETKSKAQELNNQLGQITDRMMAKVVPELSKSGDDLVAIAGHLGDAVAWASGHPFEAVVAALGASMGKAGLEQGVRSLVEDLFASGAGGPLLLTAAAVTITTYAGIQLIDALAADAAKAQGEAAQRDARDVQGYEPSASVEEQLSFAKAKLALVQDEVDQDKNETTSVVGNYITDGQDQASLDQKHKNHLDTLNKLNDTIERLTRKLDGVPPPSIRRPAGPGVDDSGRVNFVER